MKFYLCGFVLLRAVNFAVIACAKQKKRHSSSWLPVMATMSHTCDVIPKRENSEKNALIYPHRIVSKNECCSRNPVLLWLINPNSFDEIIRQRGEILVTASEFMTVLPLANVTQLQNLPDLRGIGGKYHLRAHHRQRQPANVASLSFALTISTFACCLSPGDIRGN